MGFFSNPFKATKAFFKNPGKVIKNDLRNAGIVPPKNATCKQLCAHNHKINNQTNCGLAPMDAASLTGFCGYQNAKNLKACNSACKK